MELLFLFISALITLILLINYLKNNKKIIYYMGWLSVIIFFLILIYNGKQIKAEFILLTNSINEPAFLQSVLNGEEVILTEKMLDVPLVAQLPELPRGCEVTSLAMLLQYEGIEVDKMELAKNVKKDPTPKTIRHGVISFGNPHDGFVGDMYSFNNPGYGVYHRPIAELASTYLPNKIIDLTGNDFEEVIKHINRDSPVWVIANTTFKTLPDSLFETWETPTGKVKITYKEHSVVVTGYDEQFIYFNDPLANEKNRKIPKENFIAAWEQMGKQAIVVE
ncbi:C39 family peptidase [Metabacillus litoralis]|uniref:C39 family peptidase n=1 Tax=Metabacillus litoralis TaxID=152268 RepID=UPI001CFC97AD|nr:C39 family peptidase [Metabacillus litoralis]